MATCIDVRILHRDECERSHHSIFDASYFMAYANQEEHVRTPLSSPEVIAVAGILLSLTGACKGRGSSETASGPAASTPAMDSMGSRDSATSPAGGATLSDANIVALLDEANAADSASGAYALRKATSPDVKAFAKLMMGDHHALRAAGQQLAQRLNVTPAPPADDPLKPAAQAEMAALHGAPKGAQFDKTYIDQEIGIHKAVLD
jgi:predicted outer membrane protein